MMMMVMRRMVMMMMTMMAMMATHISSPCTPVFPGELPAAIQASPSPLQPSLPCLGLSLIIWLSQRTSLNIPSQRLSIPGLSWLIWMSQRLSQAS